MSSSSLLEITTGPNDVLPWEAATDAPLTEAAFAAIPSELDLSDQTARGESNSSQNMPPAIEDAILSFAAGQSVDALNCLNIAIAGDMLGSWAATAWTMRFELQRELQLRREFEQTSTDYAALFGRAAPQWQAGSEPSRAAPDTQDLPRVAITGFLSRESQRPLSALRKSIRRYPGVRLNFERLRGADSEGCRALLVTCQSLRRAGKRIVMSGEETLLGLIRPYLDQTDSAGPATLWLLYLEVLHLIGNSAEYRLAAQRYARKFSVPAPTMQDPSSAAATPPAPGSANEDSSPMFYLEGVIVRPAREELAALEAWTDQQTTIIIDASRLTRIDFVSCSKLMNILSRAAQSGRTIEIRSPSELVGGLFVQMGLTEIARITPRY